MEDFLDVNHSWYSCSGLACLGSVRVWDIIFATQPTVDMPFTTVHATRVLEPNEVGHGDKGTNPPRRESKIYKGERCYH